MTIFQVLGLGYFQVGLLTLLLYVVSSRESEPVHALTYA